jgi:hypothetical protein
VLTRVAYTIGYSSGVPEKASCYYDKNEDVKFIDINCYQRAAGNVGGFIVLIGLLATATFTAVQLCFF